jgi:hypothetical protein
VITSETPYKLSEIIRDTWPNLYRPIKREYNTKRIQNKNDRNK